jgi:hypothetical protein
MASVWKATAMIKNPIDIQHARAIATEQARQNFSPYILDENMEILQEKYLEAEHCWMFFKNPEFEIPKTELLGIAWAYVVSKRGTFSMVQDLSYDAVKLHDYLQTLSNYFEKRGE